MCKYEKRRRKSDSVHETDPVSKEPFDQFKSWFDEACNRADIIFPSAFCLATTSKEGFPSARFIILASYNKDGFKFFTDYESRKAEEIVNNPNVAATFYWNILKRSIRIEGSIEKIPEYESEDYFYSKPLKRQIAAKASHQSTPIDLEDHILMNRLMIQIEDEHFKTGKRISKPARCGGYLIRPTSVEFWQGQKNGLSDRIKFRRPNQQEVFDCKIFHPGDNGWFYCKEKLSP